MVRVVRAWCVCVRVRARVVRAAVRDVECTHTHVYTHTQVALLSCTMYEYIVHMYYVLCT